MRAGWGGAAAPVMSTAPHHHHAQSNGTHPPQPPPQPNGQQPQQQWHQPSEPMYQRVVFIQRLPHEHSFGMTLEQNRLVHSYASVSYVKAGSPAARAGMQGGWSILNVNGVCMRGYGVREVAGVFRDIRQAEVLVDMRPPPRPPTDLVGNLNAAWSVHTHVAMPPRTQYQPTRNYSTAMPQAIPMTTIQAPMSMPRPVQQNIVNLTTHRSAPAPTPAQSQPSGPPPVSSAPASSAPAPAPSQASVHALTPIRAPSPVPAPPPAPTPTLRSAAAPASLQPPPPAATSAPHPAPAPPLAPAPSFTASSASARVSTPGQAPAAGSPLYQAAMKSLLTPLPFVESDKATPAASSAPAAAPLPPRINPTSGNAVPTAPVVPRSSAEKPTTDALLASVAERMSAAIANNTAIQSATAAPAVTAPARTCSSQLQPSATLATSAVTTAIPTQPAQQATSTAASTAPATSQPATATSASNGSTTSSTVMAVPEDNDSVLVPQLIMETQRHLQQILARVSAPSLPTARSTGTSAATSSLHSLQLIPPSISLPFGSVFTSASGMTAPPPPAAPTTAATAPATAPATSTAPPAAAARAPTPPPPPAPTVPLVVSLPLPASATTLPPTQPRHASEPLPPANANQVHAAQNPPSAPSTTPASPKNKKRKRQRQSTDNQRPPEPSNKGKGKQRKRRYSAPANTNAAESGDESSESQGTGDDQVPERRYSVRRRDGRARQSLTVDRLVTMGFKRSDAEASVTACGHDPDKCMVWIVSHLEEQQFQKDLNQASIQSELSKQEEAKQLKAKESEKLKNATAFPALFPTSVILSATSAAKNLKTMASTRIGEVSADSTMRQLLTKLLKLEGQAFKWYKSACECYMKQLAERLEAALGDHDVVTCCGVTTAPVNGTTTCRFVQTLAEEHTALTKALFEMPENQGGVPLAFLEADETNSFDLEEDGFEVL